MQARKYIRFHSTQELHTRAISAERRDYRIIARARAPDRSLTRALARGASPRQSASACVRLACAQRARKLSQSLDFPIFSGRLQGSIRLARAHVLPFAEPISAASDDARSDALALCERIKSKRCIRCRNRIFLHRRHHIFVVETLRKRASALESRRESSDSARVIRLGVRRRAASSAPRSPLADWLCRRSTSSPDPRTSPTFRASFSPAPPCRDWLR